MADFYVGDTVFTTDKWHDGTRRPHLVVAVKGDRVGIVPLSHTPQGEWVSYETCSRGSYLASVHFRTGRPNGQWATADQITLGGPRTQFSDTAVKAALAEYRRVLSR